MFSRTRVLMNYSVGISIFIFTFCFLGQLAHAQDVPTSNREKDPGSAETFTFGGTPERIGDGQKPGDVPKMIRGMSLDPDGNLHFTTDLRPAPKTFPGTPPDWRSQQVKNEDRKKCGVHALFAFLKLHHVSASLADVEAKLNVSQNGVNMLAMKECATAYGLNAAVVKCTPEEVDKIAPAIVLLEFGTDSAENHFDVYIGSHDGAISVIEPSTCRLESSPAESFNRHFSEIGRAHV